MSEVIRVTAPSRLHFGMFSFGQPDVRAFGGLGLMLNEPGLRLTVSESDSFTATGIHAQRATEFAQVVAQAWGLPSAPCCEISIDSAPRDHIGLGVGTQLALAVATGVARFLGRAENNVRELAGQVGRAGRSSIGTFGFELGGLIAEAGRFVDDVEAESPLVCRELIPEAWRFVLFCPREQQGLSGVPEKQAFRDLPPVDRETTDRLCRMALLEIVPAVQTHDFERFSRSIYQFGCLAGSCFAPTQGGSFASESVTRLVESLREQSVEGVGQTSWGPTVFATLPDEGKAKQLIEQFTSYAEDNDWEMILASPCNYGARVEAASASITS